MARYWNYGTYYNNERNPINQGSDSPNGNLGLNTHRYTVNQTRTDANGYTGGGTGARPNLDPETAYSNGLVMLSTNIFVKANGCTVGMIQSFTVNEQRGIDKIQAIGWEGVVQAVPQNTRGGTLQVSRIALYDSTLYNALGLNVFGHPLNAIKRHIHTGQSSLDGDTNALNTNGADSSESTRESSILNRYSNDGADSTPATDTNPSRTVSTGLVFRTLKDQRAPIEIEVQTPLRGSGISTSDYYTVKYVDCWISQYSKPYQVQQVTISEQATLAYADVY